MSLAEHIEDLNIERQADHAACMTGSDPAHHGLVLEIVKLNIFSWQQHEISVETL